MLFGILLQQLVRRDLLAKYLRSSPDWPTITIDQPFRSSSEVEEFCRTIGYRCRITQITPGPLRGRLRASKALGFPVVRIDSSQGLIFQGDRNSAVTQIAVELNQDLDLHLVKGKRC